VRGENTRTERERDDVVIPVVRELWLGIAPYYRRGSIPQHARRILILFRFSELDIDNNHRRFRRVFNACDHKYHKKNR
jgi:hypothetical protein